MAYRKTSKTASAPAKKRRASPQSNKHASKTSKVTSYFIEGSGSWLVGQISNGQKKTEISIDGDPIKNWKVGKTQCGLFICDVWKTIDGKKTRSKTNAIVYNGSDSYAVRVPALGLIGTTKKGPKTPKGRLSFERRK